MAIEINKDIIALMGTDQLRASISEFRINSALTDSLYLVSSKALGLIPKIFNGTISLAIENNSLMFHNDYGQVVIRLMHGNYPPIRKFVPQQHKKSLSLEVPSFLKQAKKASLATDDFNFLKIKLSKNKMCLSTSTRKQRKSADITHNIEYDGDEFQFALNCKSLLDLLKVCDNSQPLIMKFGQNNEALLFEQAQFKHIIVPMEVR